METNKLDSFFRKSINESEDYYNIEANNAKERIWNQVRHKKKMLVIPIFFRLLAAACILLFISTSILFVLNLKSLNRINTLVELNTEMENKAAIQSKNEIIKNELLRAENQHLPDTVFIEKIVSVAKPVIQKIRITDTVYVPQVVYVEKEAIPEFIVASENTILADSIIQKTTGNYETEILISNNEDIKKEKQKKFKLKFGGNQNTGNDGRIALSSKL
jgi:hypothetical protein